MERKLISGIQLYIRVAEEMWGSARHDPHSLGRSIRPCTMAGKNNISGRFFPGTCNLLDSRAEGQAMLGWMLITRHDVHIGVGRQEAR